MLRSPRFLASAVLSGKLFCSGDFNSGAHANSNDAFRAHSGAHSGAHRSMVRKVRLAAAKVFGYLSCCILPNPRQLLSTLRSQTENGYGRGRRRTGWWGGSRLTRSAENAPTRWCLPNEPLSR